MSTCSRWVPGTRGRRGSPSAWGSREPLGPVPVGSGPPAEADGDTSPAGERGDSRCALYDHAWTPRLRMLPGSATARPREPADRRQQHPVAPRRSRLAGIRVPHGRSAASPATRQRIVRCGLRGAFQEHGHALAARGHRGMRRRRLGLSAEHHPVTGARVGQPLDPRPVAHPLTGEDVINTWPPGRPRRFLRPGRPTPVLATATSRDRPDVQPTVLGVRPVDAAPPTVQSSSTPLRPERLIVESDQHFRW